MKQSQDKKKLRELIKQILEKSPKNPPPNQVTIGWPAFDEKEIISALESLLAIRISQGPKTKKFEKLCASYIGKKYAVAVNSGSSANLLALSALIAQGLPRGSEVILPATTFATVASPIIQTGLVPVYVDVDPVTWNIDIGEMKKAIGPKTRVIMPVHTFGNPVDMLTLMRIAKKHDLFVLEDCCEAHGATIGKKKVGSFGDLATLSFFVAHNVTTGEGGMIFTDDKTQYELLQSLREFGRLPESASKNKRFSYKDPVMKGFDTRYIFKNLGYNVRMTDIAASLGIEQIKKLDRLNTKRLQVVNQYNKAFKKYEDWIQLPVVRRGTFHSFYGYPFMVKKSAPFSRREFALFLEKAGIETRPFFGASLPDQPAFRKEVKRVVGKLPVAREILQQSIFIGCHPTLTDQHVSHVIKTFEKFFKMYL